MKLTLNCKAVFEGISRQSQQTITRSLTIPNPKHADAVKAGRWTGNIDPQLKFFRHVSGGLEIPIGYADRAYQICTGAGGHLEIEDQRTQSPCKYTFKGELRPFQAAAVGDMQTRDHGVLESGTGSGKTVMALYLITARGQRALVIVYTSELLLQWIERIGQFLGIPADEVGVIGNGKFDLGERVTVGMVQTLCKRVDDLQGVFGHVVVDECHRCPSKTFMDVVGGLDPKYILGLTATAYRRDGLGRVIFLYLGDRRHRVEKADLIDRGHLCNAVVVWHETGFDTCLNPSEQYSRVLSQLTQDLARNRQICADIAREDCQGIRLVLSDRKAHCYELQRILNWEHDIDAAVLVGGLSPKKREEVTRRAKSGETRVLICTGQLIGEGYDLPGIEAVFLATPIKFSGRLIQYIGRALRPAPGKAVAVIHDYVDHHVGVLAHSAKCRAQIYEREGIRPA